MSEVGEQEKGESLLNKCQADETKTNVRGKGKSKRGGGGGGSGTLWGARAQPGLDRPGEPTCWGGGGD